jgi:hypothetical protein
MMRTPEQINAELEARYAELKDEAARRKVDPKLNFPCHTCRWMTNEDWSAKYCREPLVKGFGFGERLSYFEGDDLPALCGPEKALWQKRPTLAQRIIDCLNSIFGERADG